MEARRSNVRPFGNDKYRVAKNRPIYQSTLLLSVQRQRNTTISRVINFNLDEYPRDLIRRERNRGRGNIFTYSSFLYFFIIFLSLSMSLFYMTLVRAANRSKTVQRGVKTNQFFSFQLKPKRLILLYSRIIFFCVKINSNIFPSPMNSSSSFSSKNFHWNESE